MRRSWDEIVRTIGQSSKKAAAFAREAVVREVEGNTLILVFKHKIHADGVSNDPGPLLEAAHQVIGGRWQVRCETGGDQRAASSPPQRPGTTGTRTASEDRPAPARPRTAPHDNAPADEQPPDDTDFSGPAWEGFDPGDEPDTDTDSLTVRQTSEQQALESLRKNFNLEKISEER